MKYAVLFAACCLSGCGDDGLGVRYLGIDLTGTHELALPAELAALDAEMLGDSTGRVDVFPGEGHLTVDVVGLPPLPVDFTYVPAFAFGSGPRDALGPHGEEGHSHDGMAWDLVGSALEEDEDGGMASMLMLGDGAKADLESMRNAALLIMSVPELEPPTTPVQVLEGELVVDETEHVEGGAAEPAGHNHGP